MLMSKDLKAELAAFSRGHWPMILPIVPMALLFTVLHEAAHALAVVVQGGTMLKFVWLPTWREWGYVRYEFPQGAEYSSVAIAVAPYCMWLLICLFTALLGLRRRPWPYWFAGTVFLWMFAAPLADIANMAIPYLIGADNDFSAAFGPPNLTIRAIIGLGGVLSAVAGFAVQQRLYRERALSPRAYIIIFSLALVFVTILSSARLF